MEEMKKCDRCSKEDCEKCVIEDGKSYCCENCCGEAKKEKEAPASEEKPGVCRFC